MLSYFTYGVCLIYHCIYALTYSSIQLRSYMSV